MRDDRVAAADRPAANDDTHHTRLEYIGASCITRCNLSPETLAKAIDLHARRTQTGDFEDRVAADAQACAPRKRQQVQSARRNIFTQRARPNLDALCMQLVEQFDLQKMHLTQIRATRVQPLQVPVLHGLPAMRIAFHAQSRQKPDTRFSVLGERVLCAAMYSRDAAR